MELKADVRAIKKPTNNYYGFIVTFISALLIGGGFYHEDISIFLKGKVDFNKILNNQIINHDRRENDRCLFSA